MKIRTGLSILAFIISASLSALGATGLFNAILIGLDPAINAGCRTLPIICMVFFGLLAIVAPMIILLGGKQDH